EALQHGVVGASELSQLITSGLVQTKAEVVVALCLLNGNYRPLQACANRSYQQEQGRSDQQDAGTHQDGNPEAAQRFIIGPGSIGRRTGADGLTEGEQAVDGGRGGFQPLLVGYRIIARGASDMDLVAQ